MLDFDEVINESDSSDCVVLELDSMHVHVLFFTKVSQESRVEAEVMPDNRHSDSQCVCPSLKKRLQWQEPGTVFWLISRELFALSRASN